MSRARGSFTPWYAAAALSAWLLAGPALAEHNECERRCVANQSTETESCVLRCGKPGDNAASQGKFQECVEGCSAQFTKVYKKCAKGCGGEEDAKAAAEKKKKKEEEKKSSASQAPIHGSQGIRRR